MKLSDASVNDHVSVVSFQGGHHFSKRISDLGIYPGQSLRVVNRVPAGPVVVKVMQGNVIIGRGMAAKILVKKTDDDEQ
jgi:Fe2+ transport system protein FeoA